MRGHALPAALTTPVVTVLDAVPRRVDARVDIDRLCAAIGRGTHLLETVPGTPHAGRWSYVVLPGDGQVVDDGRATSFHDRDGSVVGLGSDPFAALSTVCDDLGLSPDAATYDGLPPFTGGLVGILSYELGRRIERLPASAQRDRRLPHLLLDLTAAVIAIDHDDEQALLIERSSPRLEQVRQALRDVRPPSPEVAQPRQLLTSTLSAAAYAHVVGAALEHIAAGDAFQVNLSQRLTGLWRGDVTQLYRALRSASRAAFGAQLDWPGRSSVASISPELFLRADGRRVTTRPIKGTRPRRDAPDLDAAEGQALEASQKDRAENVMVVDMERNDLGRVCRVGSVQVPALLELEGHPTVWHLVSTVTGDLRPDLDYGDLLRAAFPCGSVTGTPKVAAMTLIDRYEPVRREWYCGALGFIAPGAMSTSVTIRTSVLHPDGTVDYAAGGGIVADSDPVAEYHESLDKAHAFATAVNGGLQGDVDAWCDR